MSLAFTQKMSDLTVIVEMLFPGCRGLQKTGTTVCPLPDAQPEYIPFPADLSLQGISPSSIRLATNSVIAGISENEKTLHCVIHEDTTRRISSRHIHNFHLSQPAQIILTKQLCQLPERQQATPQRASRKHISSGAVFLRVILFRSIHQCTTSLFSFFTDDDQ